MSAARARAGSPRVALVVPPWASSGRPSLAAGLLQASAREAGFDCATHYLNVDFAATFGVAAFEAMAGDATLFPLGEHLFAVDVFGRGALDSDAFLARHAAGGPEGSRAVRFRPDTLAALRDVVVPASLDRWTRRLLDAAPDVVGFTCVFNQVLPSLALARRLKRARPDLVVLLGGACVHGAMGEAYARAFPDVVDHVFTGEADAVFPRWLQAHARGEADVALPGVTRGGRLAQPPVLVAHLDAIPTPCYDDYFAERDALRGRGIDVAEPSAVPFESSRGCWWGAKHHCTFCGLNNEGIAFRRKSPARVVAELSVLRERTGSRRFAAADNILAHDGYDTLLPALATLGDARFFYEIKANVRRDDVAMLRRAGVDHVQPGVESFSDHVLQLMRKGVTGAQNVQLLKWLAEHDVRPSYNLLAGFPGETDADYDETLALLPRLAHLPPPSLGYAIAVQVHRFAPFFDDSAALGILNRRASAYYRHLIPPDVLDPESFAYFFDHDLPPDAPLPRHRARLDAAIAAWTTSARRVHAELARDAVRVHVSDGRASVVHALDAERSIALLLCDAVTSETKLARDLAEVRPALASRAPALLAGLVASGLVVRVGRHAVGSVPMAEACTSADLRGWLAGR